MSPQEKEKDPTKIHNIPIEQYCLLLDSAEATGRKYYLFEKNGSMKGLYLALIVDPDFARTLGIPIENSAIDWIPHKIRSVSLDHRIHPFPKRLKAGYITRITSGNLGPYELPMFEDLVVAQLRGYWKEREADEQKKSISSGQNLAPNQLKEE